MAFLKAVAWIVGILFVGTLAQQCHQSDTREAREKAVACLQSNSAEVCAAYCTAEYRSGGYMAGQCMSEVIR